jgi:hypothetical protein
MPRCWIVDGQSLTSVSDTDSAIQEQYVKSQVYVLGSVFQLTVPSETLTRPGPRRAQL